MAVLSGSELGANGGVGRGGERGGGHEQKEAEEQAGMVPRWRHFFVGLPGRRRINGAPVRCVYIMPVADWQGEVGDAARWNGLTCPRPLVVVRSSGLDGTERSTFR